MQKGENSIIVTGNTGTIASESNVELYVTDNDGVKTSTLLPNGPIEDDITLKTESLIPMVLNEYEFPVVGYLLEEEETDDEVESTVVTSDDEEEDEKPRLGPTLFVEEGILTFLLFTRK